MQQGARLPAWSRWLIAPLAVLWLAPAAAAQSSAVGGCGDLVLQHGKVVTLDGRNTIASSLVISDGRIAAVGTGPSLPTHRPCARVVDLGGRTVIPGLIDTHAHILSVGLRPGYDVRLDDAMSIADVQRAIRTRVRDLPAGAFLTAIGGWHPNQLREKRLPTLAELDAASPDHPVFVCLAFAGPGATNARGKAFFESHGIAVGSEGRLDVNRPTLDALNALRAIQTFADEKRGTRDALAYAARFGLTTLQDNAGGWPADVQGARGLAQLGNGGSNEMDPYTAYGPLLALHREAGLPVRMRLLFTSRDVGPYLPLLKQRLNNAYRDFGDDWLRISGIGEWITAYQIGAPPPANYEAAVRLVAEAGWLYQQHTGGLDDERWITDVWESVNRTVPLAPLHWNLAHAPGIDRPTLDRLKAMGVGAGVGGNRYLAGTAAVKGPPFRTIVESGIHTGYGTDGGNISPVNPWVHVYYLVTGKNAAGEVIEPGQQVTRLEALRLFTTQNAWFVKEEGRLGSLEVGRLADLAVLSDDVLDEKKVPDDAIRSITSVLTVVGGAIVHDAGVVGARTPARPR